MTGEVTTDLGTWLVAWFTQRGPLPVDDAKTLQGLNYFEAGLIDSMGVIELIGDIEVNFGIQFNARHFQERRFATIGGLTEIIMELRNGNPIDVE